MRLAQCIALNMLCYSPDEPRASNGEWGSGTVEERGGEETIAPRIALTATSKRAFDGESVPVTKTMSKLATGELGENLIINYLRQQGMTDARHLNAKITNFPVDLVQDHGAIEVKTGLASNGKTAQQWRATIGQPGKEETEELKHMSPEDKRAHNQLKQEAILERKTKAINQLSKELGHKVKGSTMTTIINPDTKTVDIYRFQGFHLRIPWNSPEAKKAYIGSFKYKA